jgi:hypothetical protein
MTSRIAVAHAVVGLLGRKHAPGGGRIIHECHSYASVTAEADLPVSLLEGRGNFSLVRDGAVDEDRRALALPDW